MLILISLGFRYLELKIYSIFLIILSSIIIIILSPVEDSNKPLDEKEIVIYKKRALVVWAAELSLYIFASPSIPAFNTKIKNINKKVIQDIISFLFLIIVHIIFMNHNI